MITGVSQTGGVGGGGPPLGNFSHIIPFFSLTTFLIVYNFFGIVTNRCSFNIYQKRMKIYIASFLFFLKMSLWTRSSCIHVCLGDGLGSYPGTWVINQVSVYLLPPSLLWTVHLTVFAVLSHKCHGINTIFVPRGLPPFSLHHPHWSHICLGDLYTVGRSSESRSSISLFLSLLPSISASPFHRLCLCLQMDIFCTILFGYGVVTGRRGGLHMVAHCWSLFIRWSHPGWRLTCI